MKKLLIFIVLSTCLISCNDFLETFPKGQIVAKTTSDFRLLLDNADTRYTHNLSQTSIYIDVVSDDSQVSYDTWVDWIDKRTHVKQLYAFEKEVWLPDGASGDVVWKNAYYISTLISNILDEIYRADDNLRLQMQLTAEARVHRAYAYLTLVNTYAKHYNAATAASDPGVPLIQNPVDLPSLERASVQKVYDFILADLLESVDDLPEEVSQQYSHRPTKPAAYAILARTYLYMGNYEEAALYADKSLAMHPFLYDYNTIYTGNASSDNLIGISRTNDQEMLLHKTTTKGAHLREYMQLDTITFNTLYSDYTIVDTTTTQNRDLRRPLWFSNLNENGKLLSERVAYVFSDASHRYAVDNDGNVDYTSVATPEMYVTRAESNARLGKLQEAINDINELRKHRFKTGSYTDVTLTDLENNQQKVIEETLLERRRELYGKDLRLFDIKRLQLAVEHSLGSETKSVPANDPKLIWPVHYEYLNLNPEIGQTPR
nr:RagB/SusD family nutrient uptake outer membrane protein [uncultured Polaribacter sp.]